MLLKLDHSQNTWFTSSIASSQHGELQDIWILPIYIEAPMWQKACQVKVNFFINCIYPYNVPIYYPYIYHTYLDIYTYTHIYPYIWTTHPCASSFTLFAFFCFFQGCGMSPDISRISIDLQICVKECCLFTLCFYILGHSVKHGSCIESLTLYTATVFFLIYSTFSDFFF